MSTALHLIPNNISGYGYVYGPSEIGSLPCLGVSRTVARISPCIRQTGCKTTFNVKIVSLKCALKQTSFVGKAGSGGQRRNPDFPRQNRHGFSRSRNRPNEERGNAEKIEESELLTGKNGPLLSLSNSSKFQATAAPGPREKEIVELFRKVQAHLRERAAAKEEKKAEPFKGQNKESETVDSLLKLLRKHSAEQGKRKVNGGSNIAGDFNLGQPEQSRSFNEDKSRSFLNSNSRAGDEVQEPNAGSFSRPASLFRRRSPIPKVRYEPIVSAAEKRTQPAPEPLANEELEIEPESELDSEADLEAEHELVMETSIVDELLDVESLGTEDLIHDVQTEEQQGEQKDLSSMKLSELRAVAKARGVKGFSKLKKAELVGLLSEESV